MEGVRMSKKLINIIITIIVVITIILITFSITYSWFLVSHDTDVINNSAKAGKLEIVYQNGQDITGVLNASRDSSSGLSTTATIRRTSTSVDALATITLHITAISSELATSAFKWEVYENNGSSPIATNNFNQKSAGDDIELISNYLLTTTDTTFTIKIWIDGNLNNNSLMNKSFSGYIDASAVNKPANNG